MNQPGDVSEQEAEAVARKVGPQAAPDLQRKSDSHGYMQAPASVHQTLQAPGQPLDSELQQRMEPRLGHEFSAVRVHTDSQAARSAEDVSAQAYTVGQHIVFGAGQYAPGTQAGDRLVAHELTHVAQQQHAGASLFRKVAGRQLPMKDLKYPNLVFYQNHSQDADFFCSIARRIARKVGGLSLDLDAKSAPKFVGFGPIPYENGADIIKAIELAHAYTGKPATQVHIVGHSGPSGIYSTGDIFEDYGLYEESRILSDAERAKGGRTLADLPVSALADNVVFVLYGCSTAMTDNSFAKNLLHRLIGTSAKAKVYGRPTGGDPSRKADWKEFTAKHPEGRGRPENPWQK